VGVHVLYAASGNFTMTADSLDFGANTFLWIDGSDDRLMDLLLWSKDETAWVSVFGFSLQEHPPLSGLDDDYAFERWTEIVDEYRAMLPQGSDLGVVHDTNANRSIILSSADAADLTRAPSGVSLLHNDTFHREMAQSLGVSGGSSLPSTMFNSPQPSWLVLNEGSTKDRFGFHLQDVSRVHNMMHFFAKADSRWGYCSIDNAVFQLDLEVPSLEQVRFSSPTRTPQTRVMGGTFASHLTRVVCVCVRMFLPKK
jgi:hypothetical protein